MLDAHGLHYAYGDGHTVVRGASLTVEPGRMIAVIGANGSGKSTLVRMLAGLLRPRAGTITLDGVALNSWEPRLRARHIAYVPQATATAFPFQVIDIVLSGRTPHAPKFRFETADDREKAMKALDSAGAAHLAARAFTGLSGGERQMVILARALAQEPRLLLLDEPSSSLDLRHRADLIRTLVHLRKSQTLSVVMVTHDLQLTRSFDRILAMRSGEVAGVGTPDEVLRAPLLRDVYGDPGVRTQHLDGQTLVWIDV